MDDVLSAFIGSLHMAAEQLGLPDGVVMVVAICSLVVGLAMPIVLLALPSAYTVGNVTRLFVHPVKGCRGMQVEEWPISKTGLMWDRAWMITREESGEFVSQRQASALAGISAKVGHLDEGAGGGLKPWDGDCLVLSAPKCGSITVPITDSSGTRGGKATPAGAGVLRATHVFGKELHGVDQGDAAARWIENAIKTLGGDLLHPKAMGEPNDIIGVKLRLLLSPSDNGAGGPGEEGRAGAHRHVGDKHARDGCPGNLSFADAMPILVANESNLDDLGARMDRRAADAASSTGRTPIPVDERPVDIRRFRPNIVVNNPKPWAEDNWGVISIRRAAGADPSSGAKLHRTMRCGRCSVPSVDPATHRRAGFTHEPLATMRTFRKHPKNKANVCFGSYFAPHRTAIGHVIRVGDTVAMHEVDERPV